MARALPVVASALPGTVELMDGTGSSFPVGDADGLARALGELLGSLPAQARGLEARAVAEAYHPARAAAETLEQYEDLLACAGGMG